MEEVQQSRTRIALRPRLRPQQVFQASMIIAAILVLLSVFVVGHRAPLWILQAGMLASISGLLAWPPRTFRTVSVWILWLLTVASIVASIILNFIR